MASSGGQPPRFAYEVIRDSREDTRRSRHALVAEGPAEDEAPGSRIGLVGYTPPGLTDDECTSPVSASSIATLEEDLELQYSLVEVLSVVPRKETAARRIRREHELAEARAEARRTESVLEKKRAANPPPKVGERGRRWMAAGEKMMKLEASHDPELYDIVRASSDVAEAQLELDAVDIKKEIADVAAAGGSTADLQAQADQVTAQLEEIKQWRAQADGPIDAIRYMRTDPYGEKRHETPYGTRVTRMGDVVRWEYGVDKCVPVPDGYAAFEGELIKLRDDLDADFEPAIVLDTPIWTEAVDDELREKHPDAYHHLHTSFFRTPGRLRQIKYGKADVGALVAAYDEANPPGTFRAVVDDRTPSGSDESANEQRSWEVVDVDQQNTGVIYEDLPDKGRRLVTMSETLKTVTTNHLRRRTPKNMNRALYDMEQTTAGQLETYRGHEGDETSILGYLGWVVHITRRPLLCQSMVLREHEGDAGILTLYADAFEPMIKYVNENSVRPSGGGLADRIFSAYGYTPLFPAGMPGSMGHGREVVASYATICNMQLFHALCVYGVDTDNYVEEFMAKMAVLATGSHAQEQGTESKGDDGSEMAITVDDDVPMGGSGDLVQLQSTGGKRERDESAPTRRAKKSRMTWMASSAAQEHQTDLAEYCIKACAYYRDRGVRGDGAFARIINMEQRAHGLMRALDRSKATGLKLRKELEERHSSRDDIPAQIDELKSKHAKEVKGIKLGHADDMQEAMGTIASLKDELTKCRDNVTRLMDELKQSPVTMQVDSVEQLATVNTESADAEVALEPTVKREREDAAERINTLTMKLDAIGGEKAQAVKRAVKAEEEIDRLKKELQEFRIINDGLREDNAKFLLKLDSADAVVQSAAAADAAPPPPAAAAAAAPPRTDAPPPDSGATSAGAMEVDSEDYKQSTPDRGKDCSAEVEAERTQIIAMLKNYRNAKPNVQAEYDAYLHGGIQALLDYAANIVTTHEISAAPKSYSNVVAQAFNNRARSFAGSFEIIGDGLLEPDKAKYMAAYNNNNAALRPNRELVQAMVSLLRRKVEALLGSLNAEQKENLANRGMIYTALEAEAKGSASREVANAQVKAANEIRKITEANSKAREDAMRKAEAAQASLAKQLRDVMQASNKARADHANELENQRKLLAACVEEKKGLVAALTREEEKYAEKDGEVGVELDRLYAHLNIAASEMNNGQSVEDLLTRVSNAAELNKNTLDTNDRITGVAGELAEALIDQAAKLGHDAAAVAPVRAIPGSVEKLQAALIMFRNVVFHQTGVALNIKGYEDSYPMELDDTDGAFRDNVSRIARRQNLAFLKRLIMKISSDFYSRENVDWIGNDDPTAMSALDEVIDKLNMLIQDSLQVRLRVRAGSGRPVPTRVLGHYVISNDVRNSAAPMEAQVEASDGTVSPASAAANAAAESKNDASDDGVGIGGVDYNADQIRAAEMERDLEVAKEELRAAKAAAAATSDVSSTMRDRLSGMSAFIKQQADALKAAQALAEKNQRASLEHAAMERDLARLRSTADAGGARDAFLAEHGREVVELAKRRGDPPFQPWPIRPSRKSLYKTPPGVPRGLEFEKMEKKDGNLDALDRIRDFPFSAGLHRAAVWSGVARMAVDQSIPIHCIGGDGSGIEKFHPQKLSLFKPTAAWSPSTHVVNLAASRDRTIPFPSYPNQPLFLFTPNGADARVLEYARDVLSDFGTSGVVGASIDLYVVTVSAENDLKNKGDSQDVKDSDWVDLVNRSFGGTTSTFHGIVLKSDPVRVVEYRANITLGNGDIATAVAALGLISASQPAEGARVIRDTHNRGARSVQALADLVKSEDKSIAAFSKAMGVKEGDHRTAAINTMRNLAGSGPAIAYEITPARPAAAGVYNGADTRSSMHPVMF